MSEELLSRILLATDGSADARLAARAAADVSKRTGAQLHVSHVWRPLSHHAYPGFAPEEFHPLYEQAARRLLAEQVGLIEEAGGVVAEAHLVAGRPADEVIDLAEKVGADLIVVGSRGLGPVLRLVVGSVSGEIVHHANRPVLVVRGGERAWPPKRVIVGDDGSAPAKEAGELASGMAGILGAEVALVRAYENPPEPIGGWSAERRRGLDEWLARERRAVEERARGLEAVAGSRPETRMIDTEPALAMLVLAEEWGEEETLLAVGSRGLGAARQAMLGSVSSKVLRAARGPVLVCPRATRNEG